MKNFTCLDNIPPRIGDKIQNFEAEAFYQNKIKKIKLSNILKQKKWVVMFFYPADFTFVCPTELEEMADNYKKLKKLDVEVLSVSTDTAFVHKAWHDKSPSIKKIKFPMLADPSAKICRQFGTLIENDGLSLRATFIIDPQGVLKAYEIQDNSIGRSAVEIIRKLQAAKFTSEHKGLVCPASWTPGKKTLKPGLDLVGKI